MGTQQLEQFTLLVNRECPVAEGLRGIKRGLTNSPSISYLLLHNKLPQILRFPHNKHLLSHMALVSQECRSGSAACLWLRVSLKIAGARQQGLQSCEGLTRAAGPLPIWFLHVTSKLVLAAGRRPQFSTCGRLHGGLPECPSVTRLRSAPPEQVTHERMW